MLCGSERLLVLSYILATVTNVVTPVPGSPTYSLLIQLLFQFLIIK